MRATLLLVFLFISIHIFCQEIKGPSSKEKLLISDTVRQTLYNYLGEVYKSGLTGEFKYLDSSEDFFWVPPGYNSAIAYDSVAKILRQNAPQFKSINNAYETLKIIVLSKRFASYSAILHSTSIDKAGKIYESKLIETGILIKREDGWKLQSGQTSVLN